MSGIGQSGNAGEIKARAAEWLASSGSLWQLLSGLGITQQTLRAHLQQGIGFRGIKFFGHNDDSRIRVGFQDVCQQSAGCGSRNVRVHYVYNGFGNFNMPQVRSQC